MLLMEEEKSFFNFAAIDNNFWRKKSKKSDL